MQTDSNRPAGSPVQQLSSAQWRQARRDFLSSSASRSRTLLRMAEDLLQAPSSRPLRESLARRTYAMAAAAQVLRLTEFEQRLNSIHSLLMDRPTYDSAWASQVHALLQTLATAAQTDAPLGAETTAAMAEPPLDPVFAEPARTVEPVAPPSLRCFTRLSERMLQALGSCDVPHGQPALQLEPVASLDGKPEPTRLGTELYVVDADLEGTRAFLDSVLTDSDPVLTRVVVVGTFDTPEAAATFVHLGCRKVLPKPVIPTSLRQAILEAAAPVQSWLAPGRLGALALPELAARLQQEVERSLITQAYGEAVGPVDLGEGSEVMAAIWSALARIREVVTMRSGGLVRFRPDGPEHAVPLLPWSAEPREGNASRNHDEISLQGRKILIADDDPAIVWFLAGVLRPQGAVILEAQEGTRALQLAQQHWPDLVLSDVLMPGLDGFSLCRALKSDVALSDTPVILISWKEDLLQRVRELGANADGYLRKEATASTVLRRVREVLFQRARVEARLNTSEELRGRLDGLTPRLLLELVCARGGNVTLAIRDAAFLYELEIRQGRLQTALRATTEGELQHGHAVLAAFLGIRAGRFAIRSSAAPIVPTFDGDLPTVLAPAFERCRAFAAALQGEALHQVQRIDLDMLALAPYLEASPRAVRELCSHLQAGAAPGSLARREPALVEPMLQDIARHGCIRALHLKQGGVLDGSQTTDVTRTLVDFDTPVAGDSLTPAISHLPSYPDPEFALNARDLIVTGSFMPSADSARSPTDSLVHAVAYVPVPGQHAEPTPHAAMELGARAASLAEEPVSSSVADAPRVPLRSEPAASPLTPADNITVTEPSRDLGELVFSTLRATPEPPVVRPPASLADDISDATQDQLEESLRQAATAQRLAPPTASPNIDEPVGVASPASATLPGLIEQALTRDATPALEESEAAVAAVAAAATLRPRAQSELTEPARRVQKVELHLERLGEPQDPSSNPPLPAQQGPVASAPHVVWERVRRYAGPMAAAAATGVIMFGALKTWGPSAPDAQTSVAGLEPLPLQPTAELGAAPMLRETPPTHPSLARQVEPPRGVPGARPLPVANSHAVKLTELDLPEGIAVQQGKGLLEITTHADEKLYVSDVFVGSGPLRHITLRAGVHEVRVVGNPKESVFSVAIKAGRRMRAEIQSLEPVSALP